MTRAPDLVEPFIGWRTWRVAETPGGLRLWSVIYDEAWSPRRPFQARCATAGSHAAPDGRCACGVYASRSATAATRYLLGRDDPIIVQRVVGLVALWGHVYEGAAGWRGEFAYPVRLYVPDAAGTAEVASRLATYRVDVEPLEARRAADVEAALVDVATHGR